MDQLNHYRNCIRTLLEQHSQTKTQEDVEKKPIERLEYVLVHEMVHLLERHHNDRFKTYMDNYLPQWQCCRDILKREPLGNDTWKR